MEEDAVSKNADGVSMNADDGSKDADGISRNADGSSRNADNFSKGVSPKVCKLKSYSEKFLTFLYKGQKKFFGNNFFIHLNTLNNGKRGFFKQ